MKKIENRMVRFRTLGCYPLTGAIESTASSVKEIIIELLESKNSEREGRAIDKDQIGSMEKKKQEGILLMDLENFFQNQNNKEAS